MITLVMKDESEFPWATVITTAVYAGIVFGLRALPNLIGTR